MKRIFFCFIVLAAICTGTMAQSQGSISVGGEFYLWFQNPKTVSNGQTTDGTKTTSFTLLPSAEYFVAEDVSLGLGIGYDMTRYKQTNGDIERDGKFYIMPYARKYFKMGDKLDIFGEANLSLGLGNDVFETKAGNSTITTKYASTSFSIGISPGLSYHLSDKVALESTFGFFGYSGTSVETGSNTKSKTNNFGLQLNSSTITFGVRFFLR